ncbi:M56 family metallopeptidase [Hymenobacter sp. B81]|uniref:M56 family metallopeptidase n=1 Tax=Hymenobacter sp. B81 TaxID=3344878 RepID=UPI0037DD59E8
MNWLENLLTPALVRAVGYTILHSLWQGAVVALALAGLLLLLRRHSARVRYSVTAAALGLLLLLAGVTFLRYYLTAPVAIVTAAGQAQLSAAVAPVAAVASSPAAAHPLSAQVVLAYFEHNLPLIVTVWLLGLLTMSLRLLGGLAYVQRLRHYGTRPLGLAWQHRLASLSARAGLKRPVTLLESSLVRVPVVVGHLKPLILLPLGAVAGLSPAQMEAILAHELAHVARRDYLVNIIQSVAEILFFYHPAMWFLTATLRAERENCCDDVAASLCGDPLVLARALAALAELGLERTVAPRLTMAAVGPRGSLLGRVRRLVQGRGAPTFSEGFWAACVVMMGMVLLGISAVTALAHPQLAVAAPRLLRQAVLPVLRAPASPAPALVAALAPAPPTVAADDDDDKDRKRKAKRRKGGETRVIVLDGADAPRRRGQAGSVIIEKDKKGRLTDLYVDGQRVETAAPDRRGGKKDDERVEVIQLPQPGRGYAPARAYTYWSDGKSADKYLAGKLGRDFDQARFQEEMARLQAELHRSGSQLHALAGGHGPSPDTDRIVREALRSAERGLEQARLRGDLSEADKAKIEQELERVREQRHELDEKRHEAEEQRREETLRLQDEARVERDRLRAERDRARAERDRVRAERDARIRKAEDDIITELVKDGLIKDKQTFQLSLTARELVVNGQKQPAATAAKYRRLYEEGTGRTISETGTVLLNASGGNMNRIYTSSSSSDGFMPAPPAPPTPPTNLAPAAPKALRAPRAPRPPRAPKAVFNSTDVRAALIRDNIIGATDQTLQLRLNSKEMVVNGKKQPADVAERYRKLLGGTEGGSINMNVTITND